MKRIIVTGPGTDLGKTVVAAIITIAFQGDYWKPIQCGDAAHSDTETVSKWLKETKCQVFPPAYAFHTPVSPHKAARIENKAIEHHLIKVPVTSRTLIIETAGGIFVPLRENFLSINLFEPWDCKWIIVSRHYLGSINHTLLTIEALKHRKQSLLGVIFNGSEDIDTESAILDHSQLPFLGRLLPEKQLSSQTIKKYASKWKPSLIQHL